MTKEEKRQARIWSIKWWAIRRRFYKIDWKNQVDGRVLEFKKKVD